MELIFVIIQTSFVEFYDKNISAFPYLLLVLLPFSWKTRSVNIGKGLAAIGNKEILTQYGKRTKTKYVDSNGCNPQNIIKRCILDKLAHHPRAMYGRQEETL